MLASGASGADPLGAAGSTCSGTVSIAPVVIQLRARYATAKYIDLFTAAGLAVVVIGSVGAAQDRLDAAQGVAGTCSRAVDDDAAATGIDPVTRVPAPGEPST